MVIPRSLGGLQVDPLTYLRVVELLAEGAGSVGWNLANNSIGQLVTLGLPDEGVHEIYAAGHRSRHRRHRGAGRRAGGAGRGRLSRQRALDLRQRLPGELLDAGKLPDPRRRRAAPPPGWRLALLAGGVSARRSARSSREAGTWPGCAAPAASTGRSRTSSCRSGGRAPRRRAAGQPVVALARDHLRLAEPGLGRAAPQLGDHRHRARRHRCADRAGRARRRRAAGPAGSATTRRCRTPSGGPMRS